MCSEIFPCDVVICAVALHFSRRTKSVQYAVTVNVWSKEKIVRLRWFWLFLWIAHNNSSKKKKERTETTQKNRSHFPQTHTHALCSSSCGFFFWITRKHSKNSLKSSWCCCDFLVTAKKEPTTQTTLLPNVSLFAFISTVNRKKKQVNENEKPICSAKITKRFRKTSLNVRDDDDDAWSTSIRNMRHTHTHTERDQPKRKTDFLWHRSS